MSLDTLMKKIDTAKEAGKEVPQDGVAKKAKTVSCSQVNAAEPQKKSGKPGKSVDEIAREVIQGLWGNGAERKNRLIEAGYDFDAVQKRVNELLK